MIAALAEGGQVIERLVLMLIMLRVLNLDVFRLFLITWMLDDILHQLMWVAMSLDCPLYAEGACPIKLGL